MKDRSVLILISENVVNDAQFSHVAALAKRQVRRTAEQLRDELAAHSSSGEHAQGFV
ncbi:MAG: hypothetical protein ACXVI1_10600 [Halobacteriota archaeon]